MRYRAPSRPLRRWLGKRVLDVPRHADYRSRPTRPSGAMVTLRTYRRNDWLRPQRDMTHEGCRPNCESRRGSSTAFWLFWLDGDHLEATPRRPSRGGRSWRRDRDGASRARSAVWFRRLTQRAKPSGRDALGHSPVGARCFPRTRSRSISLSTEDAEGAGSTIRTGRIERAGIVGTTPVPDHRTDSPGRTRDDCRDNCRRPRWNDRDQDVKVGDRSPYGDVVAP